MAAVSALPTAKGFYGTINNISDSGLLENLPFDGPQTTASPESDKCVDDNIVCEENWEEELDLIDPYAYNTAGNVFRHPVVKQSRGKSPVDFTFIPSAEHTPCIPDYYYPEQPMFGQFDDADNDNDDS
uniref:Uncharacterized protein LOC102808168 n=1 Tax=Saccoglossus kowalevskii TaxID=10224 RepID=A0ABM0M3S9_SACKO|nr:PREDICTED: uncharacterized protein LOC102808168 [Saccoglossus kowalevskii]